jgi:hypothetical protein
MINFTDPAAWADVCALERDEQAARDREAQSAETRARLKRWRDEKRKWEFGEKWIPGDGVSS